MSEEIDFDEMFGGDEKLSPHQEKIYELLAEAQSADDRAKIDLVEQAIRLADQHNDRELQMETRSEMVEAGTWEGFPEQQMLAFQWMLGQMDRDAELAEEWQYQMLFRYKWIANHISEFATIAIPRIHDLINDMARRYEAAGASMRPVYQQWATNLARLGDLDGAKAYHKKWADAPRDEFADCLACELSQMIDRALERGDVDGATEIAKPLLTGKASCAEQPQVTQSVLLTTLLFAGKTDEAAVAQKKSQKMMFDSRNYLLEMGYHFSYFGLTSQWSKGIKWFEKRLGWAMAARNHFKKMNFLHGASLFFDRMAKEKDAVKLSLPNTFAGHQESSKYQAADVAAVLRGEVDAIAAQFDRRNGNKIVSNRVNTERKWVELAPFST